MRWRGEGTVAAFPSGPIHPPSAGLNPRNFLKPASRHLIAPSHGTHAFIMLCAVFVFTTEIPSRICCWVFCVIHLSQIIIQLVLPDLFKMSWLMQCNWGKWIQDYLWPGVRFNWIIEEIQINLLLLKRCWFLGNRSTLPEIFFLIENVVFLSQSPAQLGGGEKWDSLRPPLKNCRPVAVCGFSQPTMSANVASCLPGVHVPLWPKFPHFIP